MILKTAHTLGLFKSVPVINIPTVEKFLSISYVINIIHKYLYVNKPLLISNVLCSDEMI